MLTRSANPQQHRISPTRSSWGYLEEGSGRAEVNGTQRDHPWQTRTLDPISSGLSSLFPHDRGCLTAVSNFSGRIRYSIPFRLSPG